MKAKTNMRVSLLLCSAAIAASAPATAAVQQAKVLASRATNSGQVNLAKLAADANNGPAPEFASSARTAAAAKLATSTDVVQRGRIIPSRVPSMTVVRKPLASLPNDAARVRAVKAALGMSSQSSALKGFNGLNARDQRFADNGNQFQVTPPDQALATDGRYVLEAVNNAIQVFDASGKALIPPVSMNRFLNLQSEYNRATRQYGPGLSDPRALYDADSKRWFVFEWGTGKYANGANLGNSQQFVAVSTTSNPLGNYVIFNYDTTSASVPGCPCLPDYNQVSVDKNGIYVSSNLFGLAGVGFAGTAIYALSKPGLTGATGTPVLQFLLPNDYTVHPALVPPKAMFASAENGTQYFLEGLADISQTGSASAVRVFAVSNTNSLAGPDFSQTTLNLGSVDVPTQTYNEPFVVPQPEGPRPYGASLVKPGQKLPPVPFLSPGPAKFSANPYYVNGNLWGVVTTGIPDATGQNGKDGLAYFVISPTGGAMTLSASLTTQGLITAPGNASLMYGAIAMPVSGRGGIGFALSGPGNYPSTGVASLSIAGWGPLQLTGIGAQPLDDFSGYSAKPFRLKSGRFGDYGAAMVNPNGSLVFANEYVPDTAVFPRASITNWGTFITTIRP